MEEKNLLCVSIKDGIYSTEVSLRTLKGYRCYTRLYVSKIRPEKKTLSHWFSFTQTKTLLTGLRHRTSNLNFVVPYNAAKDEGMSIKQETRNNWPRITIERKVNEKTFTLSISLKQFDKFLDVIHNCYEIMKTRKYSFFPVELGKELLGIICSAYYQKALTKLDQYYIEPKLENLRSIYKSKDICRSIEEICAVAIVIEKTSEIKDTYNKIFKVLYSENYENDYDVDKEINEFIMFSSHTFKPIREILSPELLLFLVSHYFG